MSLCLIPTNLIIINTLFLKKHISKKAMLLIYNKLSKST